MAIAVKSRCTICGRVGCPGHKPRESQPRESAAKRGYGRRWRRHRKQILDREPDCRDCSAAGRLTEATELHHVAKVSDAPDAMFDPSNVIPLCKRCHSIRTARGE